MHHRNEAFFVKTPAEMDAYFKHIPEAMENAARVGELCSHVEFDLGKSFLPRFTVPEGYDADTYVTEVAREGLKKRIEEAHRARRQGRRRCLRRAPGAGAGRHQADAVPRLLPDRLGLHPPREGKGHPGRAGPRVGRRLAGRVLHAHHRHRSDRAQAAVRALPEPGARLDAGLRHRLLHEPARRGHQLRHAEVRQGQRRPDRHHAPDQGAQRDPRHRARDGDPVRRGRQGREVRARADPGQVAAHRRSDRERAAAEGALRREPDLSRPARHRQEARGIEPPRRHARRRRGHRRQAAVGVRALLPPRGRGRDRHPVRQGHGREGGPGEVRLPGPEDADRDPDLHRSGQPRERARPASRRSTCR